MLRWAGSLAQGAFQARPSETGNVFKAFKAYSSFWDAHQAAWPSSTSTYPGGTQAQSRALAGPRGSLSREEPGPTLSGQGCPSAQAECPGTSCLGARPSSAFSGLCDLEASHRTCVPRFLDVGSTEKEAWPLEALLDVSSGPQDTETCHMAGRPNTDHTNKVSGCRATADG